MIKDFVKLRQRERKGVISLYLDIYYKGKRKQQSLKLYLVPENTREDKRKNKETLAIAEGVCAEKLTQIKNHIFNFDEESNVRFFDYFENLCNKKSSRTWHATLRLLHDYEKRNILLQDIDKKWCMGFRDFLTSATCVIGALHVKQLSSNTQVLYYTKLKAALHSAVKDGIITADPSAAVESPKSIPATRSYLTLDELQKMAAVENVSPRVRLPFLFACLTGLRRSDMANLTWGDVSVVDGMTRITFKQQKTGGLQYLDINAQAAELLGERGANDEHVFPNMMCTTTLNEAIRQWALEAGIDKHLSLHCGRHTFATLMLTLGTDLYTVSKLLGHASIRNTQIYAKIIDKKKQEAVKNIPKINI